MSDTRMRQLLKLAAQELSNHSDPFSHDFLVRNRVSLNECEDLADQLAIGARLLLIATPRQKAQATLDLVLSENPGFTPEVPAGAKP